MLRACMYTCNDADTKKFKPRRPLVSVHDVRARTSHRKLKNLSDCLRLYFSESNLDDCERRGKRGLSLSRDARVPSIFMGLLNHFVAQPRTLDCY